MTTSGPPGESSSSGDRSHEGLPAVVRALGSLLMALGAPPDAPATATRSSAAADASTPAEVLIEDARRRAYATIDEAVEQARTTAVPGLEGVNARLDRLERRVDAIASRFEPRAAPIVDTASDGAPGAPPDAVPGPAPVGAVNGDGWTGDGGFEPGLGSLLIAVGPVSGFQGLMRVQSAIASMDAVEDVAIEGYARSEATVRAMLGRTLEATRVAEALARELGQAAHVRETSTVERRMRIGLGE